MAGYRGRGALCAAAFVAAIVSLAAPACAQDYPTRPVTLVVPFPAGGATDAIARIIIDSMSQSLGQQVVVENVGGAGGMIGGARVARAAPDGYTLLLHQVGLAAGMTLYPNASFDAGKDLTGIGLVNNSISIIAGSASLPPNTMTELVRWMKEPKRQTKIAHAGVGSYGHLCGVMFAQEIGATADQIPYRGGGPALNDLVAGHADLSCLSAAVIAPLAQSGKLKAYGVIGSKRLPALPNVPTMVEAGYRNLDLPFWHILFAPAGTPKPVIAKLNGALRHALADAKVKETFAKSGMEPFGADRMAPDAATDMLRSEIKHWGEVIRTNKIAAQ